MNAKKVGENPVSTGTGNSAITINGKPITLKKGEKGAIPQTKEAFMLLTLQNDPADSEANISYSYGSETKSQPLDPGNTVPELIREDFKGNHLEVTNITNTDTAVNVGLFGYGTPTTPIVIGGKVSIGQYQSTGGRTKAKSMILRLTSSGNDRAAVYVFAENNPISILLNTKEGDNIKSYTYCIPGNTYRSEPYNWNGKPIFIINASSTDIPVTVELMEV